MCETKNLYLWLLQFLVLVGILAICLWLLLRPRTPNYTIVDFSIPQSSLLSKEGQNGTIIYNLEIKNPNSDSVIYYDESFLTFVFGQDIVVEKRVPSFRQGTGRTTQVIDYGVANPRVWKPFVTAVSNATAELLVGLKSTIQFKTWGRRSKHHTLDFQGHFPVGSDGKISGKKKKTKLHRTSKDRMRYKFKHFL